MEHAREKGELADILDQGFIEGVFRYLIRAVSALMSQWQIRGSLGLKKKRLLHLQIMVVVKFKWACFGEKLMKRPPLVGVLDPPLCPLLSTSVKCILSSVIPLQEISLIIRSFRVPWMTCFSP